jgi:hypothetical protein
MDEQVRSGAEVEGPRLNVHRANHVGSEDRRRTSAA